MQLPPHSSNGQLLVSMKKRYFTPQRLASQQRARPSRTRGNGLLADNPEMRITNDAELHSTKFNQLHEDEERPEY